MFYHGSHSDSYCEKCNSIKNYIELNLNTIFSRALILHHTDIKTGFIFKNLKIRLIHQEAHVELKNVVSTFKEPKNGFC
jgi:hypothetical protein